MRLCSWSVAVTGNGLGRKGRPVGKKAGAQRIVGAAAGPGNKEAPEATAAGDADPFDRWLEDKLRNAYSSVLEEPIPEDLLKLLHQRLKD